MWRIASRVEKALSGRIVQCPTGNWFKAFKAAVDLIENDFFHSNKFKFVPTRLVSALCCFIVEWGKKWINRPELSNYLQDNSQNSPFDVEKFSFHETLSPLCLLIAAKGCDAPKAKTCKSNRTNTAQGEHENVSISSTSLIKSTIEGAHKKSIDSLELIDTGTNFWLAFYSVSCVCGALACLVDGDDEPRFGKSFPEE